MLGFFYFNFEIPSYQEPLSVARAKSLLERAAAGGHLPAVYLLVELLDREGALDKAIDLLKVSSCYVPAAYTRVPGTFLLPLIQRQNCKHH